MNKKLKQILSIILFVIGLIIICSGIFLMFKNIQNNNQSNEDNNSNIGENNNQDGDNIDEEENSELELLGNYSIDDFNVDKNEKNTLKLSLYLVNESEEKQVFKKLYINFYDNDNKLYTFEYDIKYLNSGHQTFIETFVCFKFDEITKYEFELDGVKKVLEPTYVS